MSYIAALRYNSNAGGYAGVITWTDWGTKEDLEKFIASQSQQEVVEEGITADRAVELVRTTPAAARIEACIDGATNPKTGEVDLYYLGLKTSMINSLG